METYKYRLELTDGDLNGAVRYYNTFKAAKAQATRYINRQRFNFGVHPYAEIYLCIPGHKAIIVYESK